MFKSTKLVVLAVVLLLAVASSAFALDKVALNQQMWTWSSLEAVLSESSHNYGGHPPVIDPKEAELGIEEAKAKICKMVSGIETKEELLEARKIANEFVSMQDKEEEVGLALNKLLDAQEKYLKAHHDI